MPSNKLNVIRALWLGGCAGAIIILVRGYGDDLYSVPFASSAGRVLGGAVTGALLFGLSAAGSNLFRK
jgi:hypothetical protein